jgi:hypothetical protein
MVDAHLSRSVRTGWFLYLLTTAADSVSATTYTSGAKTSTTRVMR